MPRPGCGLWLIDNRDVDSLIRQALKAGFRHFDTAQAYFNEDGVGRALRYTEVPREQLFITSKIRGRDMGYARTLVSFNETLERLGVEYLELFSFTGRYPQKFVCGNLGSINRAGGQRSDSFHWCVQFHLPAYRAAYRGYWCGAGCESA
ncbi:aldo/keto reductase [Klebsiella pneumoniae]|nr:aldo/keto reductase [Klebsiella pneumoniae]